MFVEENIHVFPSQEFYEKKMLVLFSESDNTPDLEKQQRIIISSQETTQAMPETNIIISSQDDTLVKKENEE
ncbi:hypothetical protein LIER_43546 [Lithospermum erythrorhizon]|uniref:Uncharacterized protein n=1 Tax=Lithospermum erythrorhizon TaxID=34254 RepID=A0AAV3Q9Z7_LITER